MLLLGCFLFLNINKSMSKYSNVEWHISWQENRKQEIRYQEISCRKTAFSQEISWFCQNWPKSVSSKKPGIRLYIDVHIFNWIDIYKRISEVLMSWSPDVLMSWSPEVLISWSPNVLKFWCPKVLIMIQCNLRIYNRSPEVLMGLLRL